MIKKRKRKKQSVTLKIMEFWIAYKSFFHQLETLNRFKQNVLLFPRFLQLLLHSAGFFFLLSFFVDKSQMWDTFSVSPYFYEKWIMNVWGGRVLWTFQVRSWRNSNLFQRVLGGGKTWKSFSSFSLWFFFNFERFSSDNVDAVDLIKECPKITSSLETFF